MDGKPEHPSAEGAGEENEYVDICTPEDIPKPGPPEPLEFKWKDPKGGKYRLRVEMRWPDDIEGFQMAFQDAEASHHEAMATWKKNGKKPNEKPAALWGHYRHVRRTLIAKPTWLHNDAGVSNMPPPVLVRFHGALLSRGIGAQDFQVSTGLRSEASEALKVLLSTSGLDDGSEPSPETSENEPASTSESSSTPPSEPTSDGNGSTESVTPST